MVTKEHITKAPNKKNAKENCIKIQKTENPSNSQLFLSFSTLLWRPQTFANQTKIQNPSSGWIL